MSDEGPLFEARGLRVAIEGKEILRGVDLTINRGEVHALMGRNGSGKSTLAYVALGHPHYEVLGGQILYKGVDVTELDTDVRARMGMFLAFQYPMAIPGVTVSKFMHSALKARATDNDDDTNSSNGQGSFKTAGTIPIREFRQNLTKAMDLLGVDKSFTGRYVNDGFSGGEKKRLEILQMFMLQPEFSILDETDSGLDIDALKTVAEGVNATRLARTLASGHHALPTRSQLHRARRRARDDGRQDCAHRRSRAVASARRARLRVARG